jgi:hypothetical protein
MATKKQKNLKWRTLGKDGNSPEYKILGELEDDRLVNILRTEGWHILPEYITAIKDILSERNVEFKTCPGIHEATECPECNSSWDAGSIFEALSKQDWWQKDMDLDGLKEYVKKGYGSEDARFSRQIGVSCIRKDRTIEWVCPDCDARWDRFTEELLEKGSSNANSDV